MQISYGAVCLTIYTLQNSKFLQLKFECHGMHKHYKILHFGYTCTTCNNTQKNNMLSRSRNIINLRREIAKKQLLVHGARYSTCCLLSVPFISRYLQWHKILVDFTDTSAAPRLWETRIFVHESAETGGKTG